MQTTARSINAKQLIATKYNYNYNMNPLKTIPLLFYNSLINFNIASYNDYIHNKIFIECGVMVSGVRNVFYNICPHIYASYTVCNLSVELNQRFREVVGVSDCIIFKTLDLPIFNHYRSNEINIDPIIIFGETEYTDTIYAAFFEFSDNMEYIVANIYKTTFNYIKSKSYEFLNTNKPFIILDLDKTIYLCNDDCKENFVNDFIISGKSVSSNNIFNYMMMIRPGTREFLYRLSKIANIFALTGGDINYARYAVHAANSINWASSYDNIDCDYTAMIDINNIYSVRKFPYNIIPKKFEYVLPISVFESNEMPKIIKIAVDDNIELWAPEERQYVISIMPFNPNDNSNYLLSIATYIENIIKSHQ